METIIVKTKTGKIIEKRAKKVNYQTFMHIRISNDLFNKFKEKAKQQNLNYSDVVRKLMSDYVESEQE